MSSNVPSADEPPVSPRASRRHGDGGRANEGHPTSGTAGPSGSLSHLAMVRDAVVSAEAAVAAAEVARVRALAAAGRFALESAASARASVRASDMAMREVASEIAAACRQSDRTVQREISEAMTLVECFPATVAGWEAGQLSRRHVRAVADVGIALPRETREEFDRFAAALAREVSPGRLKTRLSVAAQKWHPQTLTERHRTARESRCVRVVTGENGMSDLIATLPTVLAEAVLDRLTQQARVIVDAREDPAVPTSPSAPAPAPDARTLDQVRADVFADMLLTGDPMVDPTRAGDAPGTLGKIRARVQVVVPALAMLAPGRENLTPAELVGHGPLDAETARRLAEATSLPWDRVVTHPITGAVLHADTYARTAAIDRFLRARDRHCRYPGCTAPAIRCEIDHSIDHARGGPTTVTNLCCLCQRHHTQKQFTRWEVRQLPGGVLEWTSPTGRVYLDTPEPYPSDHLARVRFRTDSEETSGAAPPGRAVEAAPF